ncbi:transporter substrate-binding domain-containing protein [Chachezhania antarctica]|uniref:transporter substrate-binding domain-containing protein n=1 Tax=Chachezhania antarctica TaxID=2340860 RepID=UPI0013CF2D9A|nr:transporter substrate-binding domain-containing protein [Chachezhania antarctica]
MLAAIALCGAATAQDDPAPLRAGCVDVAPLCTVAQNGEFHGFMVELARAIERHTGLEIEFEAVRIEDVIRLQNEGQLQILPGTPRLDTLAETNVTSEPVAQSETRFFVLLGNQDLVESGEPEGLNIAYVERGAGANFPQLFENNRVESRNTLDQIIIDLLAGRADASINSELGMSRLLRNLRLDSRVVAAGDPIASEPRLVYIHESRADVLGPVNDAIAAMQASGELAEMRQTWGIDAPDPVPDVLKVGSVGFPPNTINNADGTFSGFAVDALRNLADRAGLEIEFVAIDRAEFRAGPSSGTYDMLPLLGIGPERRERMDFTIPFETFPHSIFTRVGEATGISDLDSLEGRKVGVGAFNMSRTVAQAHGGLDVQVYNGPAAVLNALHTGEVDAILFVSSAMRKQIKEAGLARAIEEVSPPVLSVDGAAALRFGLGSVRERLNAVIPGFLISEDLQDLRQQYFGPPVFWTQTRIYSGVSALAVLFLAMIAFMIWQRLQRYRQQLEIDQQQRELEREQRASEELAKLVTELERSNRELDEFAYTASHDLKEPLRGIAINANFMTREIEPEEIERRVARMVELTQRMEKLISDLLYFSRLGRGESKSTDIDCDHLIRAIEGELRETMQECNASIVIETDLPVLHADPSKLKTVFQNLIVNGLKYNDAAQKAVEIGFQNDVIVNGSSMNRVFYVRDNGIGIEEKQRDKVFRIFKRLHPDSAYGRGTGAGLAFVQKIVEGYGGKITFTARPGGGTVFYFSLPLAQRENQASTDRRENVPP